MNSMIDVSTRFVGAIAAPGGQRSKLLVFTYHRVNPQVDPMLPGEPDLSRFVDQMQFVRKTFNVLPIDVAAERLAQGTLPSRPACVTFDDGYANNLTVAAPALKSLGIPATVFVTTGFTDAGRMWNDTVIEAVRHAPAAFDLEHLGLGRHSLIDWSSRRAAVDRLLDALKYLPQDERFAKAQAVAEVARIPEAAPLMLDIGQLRTLAQSGVQIGAHTVTHPILANLSAQQAVYEIGSCKQRIEELTAMPCKVFAYPNGRPGRDYRPEHVAMVREAGYVAAVSTAWGAAGQGHDVFQLPRISPWSGHGYRDKLRVVRTYFGPAAQTIQAA